MRLRLVISERRACGLVGLARTTLRRALAEPAGTVALKARIVDLAQAGVEADDETGGNEALERRVEI